MVVFRDLLSARNPARMPLVQSSFPALPMWTLKNLDGTRTAAEHLSRHVGASGKTGALGSREYNAGRLRYPSSKRSDTASQALVHLDARACAWQSSMAVSHLHGKGLAKPAYMRKQRSYVNASSTAESQSALKDTGSMIHSLELQVEIS